MSLASDFLAAGITAFGSITVFLVFCIFLYALILVFCRQKIPTNLILIMIFLDAITGIGNDVLFSIFSIAFKIILFIFLGMGLISDIRK